MIGPALQGMLLMGVIYWYTKGMLMLINDYYRDEFKVHLTKDIKKPTPVKEPDIMVNNENLPGLEQIASVKNTIAANSEHYSNIMERSSLSQSTDKQSGFPYSCHIITDTQENAELGNYKLSGSDPICQDPNVKFSKDDYRLQNNKVASCDNSASRSESAGIGSKISDANDVQTKANSGKSILNPSTENKLDYKQIANQQVSEGCVVSSHNNEGKFDGGTPLRQTPNPSLVKELCYEQPHLQVNGKVCDLKNNYQGNSVKKRASLINDGLITDTHQRYLQNKIKDDIDVRWQNSCRPKTVNDLVKFWSGSSTNADATIEILSSGNS